MVNLSSMRVLILLAVAGCGYTPPAGTNTGAAKYRTDVDACEQSVPDAVDKRNAKRVLSWLGGGVTRWSSIDDETNACMAGKGWGATRSCTAEELRGGNKTGMMVVTRNGIRCSEPPKPG